ncbi:hypothetical protein BGZ59_005822, partial [Podila verticillata]
IRREIPRTLQVARRQHHKFDPELHPLEFTPLIWDVSYGKSSLGSQRISKYLGTLLDLLPREEGQARLKVCALSASNALRKGVSIDDVTMQGNWSSSAIMESYYRISRSLASNFSTTLLPVYRDSQIESRPTHPIP